MKRSPQVSLGMLSALAKRRELREKCHQKTKEACDELYAIINDIKEKKDEYEKTLKTMHFSEETICYLFDSINDLCNRHLEHKKGGGREASSEWIARFTEKYQTTLDALANERIKFYSYRGGVAAMVSRIPAIDRFIVLSAMFSLVKDLLAIYNVKPSRTNTVILFSKVIIKTFCAGYIQEGAEKFGDGFKKAFAVSGIAFANIPFLKGITSLSVEAVAHGFLIYRIGKTAQKMLQPVLRDEK